MQFNNNMVWDGVDPNTIPVLPIETIAHALSHTCRYGGHVRTHFSVAQHSVAIAKLTLPEFFLEGLLHDASEAYIGDIPAPMKRQVPEIKLFEERIQRKIFEEYGLQWPIPEDIEFLDKAIVRTEMEMLYSHITPTIDRMLLEREGGVRQYFDLIELKEPWPAEAAKVEFIRVYKEHV